MYKSLLVLIHTLVTIHFISLVQDYPHQHSIHIVTMSSSIMSIIFMFIHIISICFYYHYVHSHISKHVFVKIIILFVSLTSFCCHVHHQHFMIIHNTVHNKFIYMYVFVTVLVKPRKQYIHDVHQGIIFKLCSDHLCYDHQQLQLHVTPEFDL